MTHLTHRQTASKQQDKSISQQRTGFVFTGGDDFRTVRVGLRVGTYNGQKQKGEALRRCGMISHSYLDSAFIVGGKTPR
ncbi:hypothetical protein LU604_03460 [Erwinia tracheiphila]|nr:hypothetical protein [Erwinia tracheiphila]UIA84137.1 hypothetical protein LU604_03460 [Erwinia tracheiphila]UIA92719.1 hypothetical protein LU632_03425 [Erwinia tracheiphila]